MNKELLLDEKIIHKKIQSAFEELGETERDAFDIAFHMTDWISDIKEIVEVYSNIEKLGNDGITHFIYRFLAHVPNHINAAKKLSGIGKTEDVFKARIFED